MENAQRLERKDGVVIEWCIEPIHKLSMDFEVFTDGEDEPSYEGAVKWDGCINWVTGDAGMAHFCDEDSVRQFASIFDELWDIARKNIEKACFSPQRRAALRIVDTSEQ